MSCTMNAIAISARHFVRCHRYSSCRYRCCFLPFFACHHCRAAASVKVTALPFVVLTLDLGLVRLQQPPPPAISTLRAFGGEFSCRLVLGTHGLESRRLIWYRNGGLASIAESRGGRACLFKFLPKVWRRGLPEQQEQSCKASKTCTCHRNPWLHSVEFRRKRLWAASLLGRGLWDVER